MVPTASPSTSRRARRRSFLWFVWTAAAILLLGAGLGFRATSNRQGRAGFASVQVAGFTTLISPSLQANPELKDRVLWRLEEQLAAAVDVLPASSHETLREIRVWVDPDSALNGSTVAMYYWQRQSLEQPPLIKQRAGDISISDIDEFIRQHGRYSVMLHELAHGYDDRRLNRQDPGVLKAFQAARTHDLYGKMGSGWNDSYAVADVREYFATLTEAYFASRPDAPRSRAELKAVDPQGFAAVQRAWESE